MKLLIACTNVAMNGLMWRMVCNWYIRPKVKTVD
jgi:hypothetical protein